jgi:hypothetical protein
VQIAVAPAASAPLATALIFGELATPACDDDSARLPATYSTTLICSTATPDTCRATFDGLRPGTWRHHILVNQGEGSGQFQTRVQLLLDRSAGTQRFGWTLFRSVHTVASLDDALDCQGCLRAALAGAEIGAKPALVQFAANLSGTVTLVAALPPLGNQVTLDGFDRNGNGVSRTIDGNGLDSAALRIVGSSNQVFGLRVTNVGGDSDLVVVEGDAANDNVLDSLQVLGRASTVCGTNGAGCFVDGVCRVPTRQDPQGVCGDDGIAVRSFAGAAGPNIIRRCVISGARDKGVKVSERGAAIVEDSIISGNTDGGLQATLSGYLTARRNIVRANRGTNTANGLAANGAVAGSPVPSRLETRGNLSVNNSLRGISVRSLSVADLRDDFVCGNGAGVGIFDAAGLSAIAAGNGLAIVGNANSGVVIADQSRASFGVLIAPGDNAIAFNGLPKPSTPANFRNQTSFPITAVGNFWEHCGPRIPCDTAAVQSGDIFTARAVAPVAIKPAQNTRRRAAPRITVIDPPFAAAGEVVRIYGSGFDAIEGNAGSCNTIADVNTCEPLHGNCVMIDRTPAEVIAVTPTMMVVRAPFTCVAPVTLATRTRWSHGFGRAQFCVVPEVS